MAFRTKSLYRYRQSCAPRGLANRDGEARGGMSLRPEETRHVYLEAYYQVLSQDKDFAQGLLDVHRLLQLHYPDPETPAGERGRSEDEDERSADTSPWRNQDRWLTDEERSEIEEFVASWPLPLAAAVDVMNALCFACEFASGPELHVSTRVTFVGAVPKPRSVTYEPMVESAAAFRARAEEVRKAADAEYAAAGWARLHQKQRSPEARRREALRLYRHAVLRCTIPGIARREAAETGQDCSPETVKTSLREWKQMLGIAVRGPVGRPRRR
jgi:hypothetical protein